MPEDLHDDQGVYLPLTFIQEREEPEYCRLPFVQRQRVLSPQAVL